LPIETPGRSAGTKNAGDAARALPARPRHHREERGLVGVGDEALGAGEAIDLAFARRPGLDGGAVRPRARLGQGEAGDDLTAGDARQPFRLLFLAAGHDQALAADTDIGAEGGAEGGRGAAKFEGEPYLLRHGQAEPAIFLGDGEAEQPQLPHLADDLVGDLVGLADLLLERPQPLGDETAHGVDEGVEDFEVEGHASSL
jgi:hypothetical protein